MDLPLTIRALYHLDKCETTKSCQFCKHALLRGKRKRYFNYEACKLGILPMIPEMPWEWRCELWERSPD